jgi:uncharacterized protein YoaH (UPF0181 family)
MSKRVSATKAYQATLQYNTEQKVKMSKRVERIKELVSQGKTLTEAVKIAREEGL